MEYRVQFPQGVAVRRDGHWHAPANLDLEANLNALTIEDNGQPASDEKVAKACALAFGGEVVAHVEPGPDAFVVNLDEAEEAAGQTEVPLPEPDPEPTEDDEDE